MTGLESLLHAALTAQASSPAPQHTTGPQHGQEAASDPPFVPLSDLLLPTATVLAHMLETHFDSQQDTGQKVGGRSPHPQGKSADSPQQLSIILSLVVFIGGISCPDKTSHNTKASSAAPADAQSLGDSPTAGDRRAAEQGAAEQEAVEFNDADSSQIDSEDAEQQLTEVAEPQPVLPAAVSQQACQELCLQVSNG